MIMIQLFSDNSTKFEPLLQSRYVNYYKTILCALMRMYTMFGILPYTDTLYIKRYEDHFNNEF